MCEVEAPNLEMKETMLSGGAWPLTIVNMTHPEVMEWALPNHDDYFSGSPGFFNSVISTVATRYDTTPDDPLISQFLTHNAHPNNPALCAPWTPNTTDP